MGQERPGKTVPSLSHNNNLQQSTEEALILSTPTQKVLQVKTEVCLPYSFIFNLSLLMKSFSAGLVSEHLLHWQALTSDPEILRIVQGDIIKFNRNPPQRQVVRQCNVSPETKAFMNEEISSMLETNIIKEVSHEPGEFLSPIFPFLKAEDKIRIILNLKDLNEYVEYHHFKMDNIKVVLANVTENCLMASLDLKHAYHSVKIYMMITRSI